MVRLFLCFTLIGPIYRLCTQIKPITCLDCSSALLLLVQFLYQGSRSSQSLSWIVPTLYSYWSNLQNREGEVANNMVRLFLCFALIHPIYILWIQIQPITWLDCSYICSYSSNLHIMDLDIANQMIRFFLLFALIGLIHKLGIQIQPITYLDSCFLKIIIQSCDFFVCLYSSFSSISCTCGASLLSITKTKINMKRLDILIYYIYLIMENNFLKRELLCNCNPVLKLAYFNIIHNSL